MLHVLYESPCSYSISNLYKVILHEILYCQVDGRTQNTNAKILHNLARF